MLTGKVGIKLPIFQISGQLTLPHEPQLDCGIEN